MSSASKIAALALAAAMMVPVLASAQGLGVAIVDSRRAAANSKEGKAAEQQLKDLSSRKRDEFMPKEEKLKRAREEYETQRFVLSKEALQEREIEIVKLRRNMERDLEEAQEEMAIEERKLMQPILRKILRAVKDVARAQGYQVVLERSSPGVLFYSDDLDITDLVIAKLNE
jgi:outer membrane protein